MLEEIRTLPVNGEPRQINSQTIKGSWKEFELYPVINDRRLELVRHELICVCGGHCGASIESRMEENKGSQGTQRGGIGASLQETMVVTPSKAREGKT